MDRVTESELAKRCREGDRKAQRELYDQTSERIFRLMLRMTRNHEAALDLSQETYLRAFNRIHQFNGQSTLATWLYRIAMNEALQFLRRQKPLHQDEWSGSEISTCEEGKKTDAHLDLGEALGELNADDQAILLLRYQEGLDYRSIATVLDCPAGTVASRLSRARQAIRGILGEDYKTREESRPATHPISGQRTETGMASDTLGLNTGSP